MSGLYRIFGSEMSPYSVKVRSYFRFKGKRAAVSDPELAAILAETGCEPWLEAPSS